jgi:hypothetical protein
MAATISSGLYSLRAGKIAGNFQKFGLFRFALVLVEAKSHSDLKGLRKIPCSFRSKESALPGAGNNLLE